MFNSNDILARLQNGEDARAIADEMAAALNDAVHTHENQCTEEELHDCLVDAADALTEYVNAKYPELADIGVEEITADDLANFFETIAPMIPMLKQMVDLEKSLSRLTDIPVRGQRAEMIKGRPMQLDDDAVLDNFLKQFRK